MDIDKLTQVAKLLGLKTFSELTEEERRSALSKKEAEVLLFLIECPEFYPELGEQLSAANEKADEMRTPWFIGEYIMDECGDEVRAIAKEASANCLYQTDLNQEFPDIVRITE